MAQCQATSCSLIARDVPLLCSSRLHHMRSLFSRAASSVASKRHRPHISASVVQAGGITISREGKHLNLQREKKLQGGRTHVCRANDSQRGSTETFLSLEEAGLIELTNLDMHERFLCRLTVSSLNLLRVISKQEGVPIENLNAGILCDWFQKDKEKREKDFESATLKW